MEKNILLEPILNNISIFRDKSKDRSILSNTGFTIPWKRYVISLEKSTPLDETFTSRYLESILSLDQFTCVDKDPSKYQYQNGSFVRIKPVVYRIDALSDSHSDRVLQEMIKLIESV